MTKLKSYGKKLTDGQLEVVETCTIIIDQNGNIKPPIMARIANAQIGYLVPRKGNYYNDEKIVYTGADVKVFADPNVNNLNHLHIGHKTRMMVSTVSSLTKTLNPDTIRDTMEGLSDKTDLFWVMLGKDIVGYLPFGTITKKVYDEISSKGGLIYSLYEATYKLSHKFTLDPSKFK